MANVNKKVKHDFIANTSFEDKYVKITVISKSKLLATLIKNDSAIANKTIKGKFNSYFFSVKKQRSGIVIPFLYTKTKGYKVLIAKTVQNELLIIAYEHQFGWILLLHAGHTKPYEMIFNSINKK